MSDSAMEWAIERERELRADSYRQAMLWQKGVDEALALNNVFACVDPEAAHLLSDWDRCKAAWEIEHGFHKDDEIRADEAEARLKQYEEPGYINSVQKVVQLQARVRELEEEA